MDKLTKLKNAYQESVTGMQTLLDSTEDALSTEQQKKFDALQGTAVSLKAQIANYEQLAAEQAIASRIVAPAKALPRQATIDTGVIDGAVDIAKTANVITIPAKVRRWAGNLRSFKGPDADVRAYRAGMYLAAILCNNGFAQKFCSTHGIATAFTQMDSDQFQSINNEGANTAGGYLVFDEFETDIIRLVEEFGLVRRLMKIVPMMSDVKITPRRTGGVSASFVGEGEETDESNPSWDQVKLVAKKLMAMSVATNELASDAIISIADEITREIALAFSTKEDVAGFQGDGTATHGSITGIVQRLSDLNGVDDGGGLVLATGNIWSEFTDVDLLKMIGRVPNFPGLRPEWTCSKAFFFQVMSRLTRAAGGVDTAEMGGIARHVYAGYAVNWTSGESAMPVADANSQIACLFGDMNMAAHFGDRAGLTIATSTEATVGSKSMFGTDSFAIRGIERFDINVHDVGSATVAGPVVGLISKAS